MRTPSTRRKSGTEDLKTLLTRTNVVIVAGILTLAAGTGYYMMSRNSGQIPSGRPGTTTVAPDMGARPEPVQPETAMSATGAGTPDRSDPSKSGRAPSSQGRETRPDHAANARDVQIRIQDFEADVLDRTQAIRVRLETPSLRALGEADAAGTSDDLLDEEALSAPGYVAFMAAPQATDHGIYNTMADIARNYFSAFPGTPRVTVSLIVGGSVRDRETFFSNGDGTVRVGG